MSNFCNGCNLPKNNDEFGLDSRAKTGLKSRCKECLRKQGRNYSKSRRENLEQKQLLNNRNKEWKKVKFEEDPNYHKKNYARNPEKRRENQRKYYSNNTEKELKNQKIWRADNREIYLQSSKNWKLNNKEKTKQIQKISSLAYRARKTNATIQDFSCKELNYRMSVFGFLCSYCGGQFEHIDHVIPLSKGGKHCLSNLRPSCQICNNKKFNKDYKVWIKEILK